MLKGLFGICVTCLDLLQTLLNIPQRKRSPPERRKLKQMNKINKTVKKNKHKQYMWIFLSCRSRF
jgi:hypothetical protein